MSLPMLLVVLAGSLNAAPGANLQDNHPAGPIFIDGTSALGIPEINAGRLCLADLDGDGWPDLVIRAIEAGQGDRYRVFMNRPRPEQTSARQFEELKGPTGLPTPRLGDCLVFADLDNDGRADAVFTRYLDINNPQFAEPAEPARTCWLRGRGDGTFEAAQVIEGAKRATTACVAIGDVDRDGKLDLWLGNWYVKYPDSNEAFTSDLLSQAGDPPRFRREALPPDQETFDEERDAAGRPMYGAVICSLDGPRASARGGGRPQLLELSYGRRANRLWRSETGGWRDCAPEVMLDGDPQRDGRYPDWLKERAKTDKRFDREDEKPYRSHGNTFDAAVGDIDSDGDFDVFFAEITHAWAGGSSDRSRFLLNVASSASVRFDPSERLSIDRIPPIPPRSEWTKPPLGTEEKPWFPRWNQGDMFCELADLDNDGRLDLILSSGDYPDPAPFDQRLRIFHQQEDGTFKDVTGGSGIDHPGSGQISIGDIDGDGDIDIVVAQSYTRLDAEQVKALNEAQHSQGPRVRVFLNQAAEKRAAAGRPANGLTLRLEGDPAQGVARDALGAVVEVIEPSGRKQLRQLIGVGGCAGKQEEFLVHFGLADGERVKVRVIWPAAEPLETVLDDVPAGRRTIRLREPQGR